MLCELANQIVEWCVASDVRQESVAERNDDVATAKTDGGTDDHCSVSAMDAVDCRFVTKCGNPGLKKMTHQ
jgi:hypothetical protein